jgi:PAS domain S-box-containing protein/putative nucleotidyltransferase with HDIG domain
MSSEIMRKEIKTKFRQLEWLIIAMAGAALGSLQIMRYAFLSTGAQPLIWPMVIDWLFVMVIITGLVHFSFREISKIQNELINKREQATKAEKRIQHIIDITQDAIFTLDCEGNFTFASKAIETLTRFSSDSILRMNIEDILSTEYRSFIYKQLKDPKDITGRHLFVDVAQQDGTIVPVEMSFISIKDYSGKVLGFQGIARDNTAHREIEKAHKEKEVYLQAIARVGQIILETPAGIPYKAILETLCKASGGHRGFVVLHDDNTSSSQHTTGQVSQTSPSDTQNMSHYIIIHDNSNSGGEHKTAELLSQNIVNTSQVENMSQKEKVIVHDDDTISVLVPIIVETKIVGIIGFNKPVETGSWQSAHINLLSTAANMVSQALERQKTNVQLKRHFISLAKIISKAMSAIDPYTASHQQRLAEMVCLVGGKVGLNPKQLEWLYFCGLLHDVGKIAIPSAILSKPGKLTSEEWGLMRSHVKRGHEILQDMNLPDNVMNTILQHHEREDGSGYPDGVKGDKLSTESRILGICDVVEAMSSYRPYRPALSKTEIFTELDKGKGSKYDPKLTDLVLTMLKNDELSPSGKEPDRITDNTSSSMKFALPNYA